MTTLDLTVQSLLRLLIVVAGLAVTNLAQAQVPPVTPGITAVAGASEPTFVINLRDADLRTMAEQVSEITGRTLILDAAVVGKVTVISAAPLNKDGVWDLFQSVLAVQGFAAVPSGNLWRVVTQQAAKESGGGGSVLEATTRLDVITRLLPLENFPATTAAAALRPLVAASGYLEAVPETNTLVITDTAENVGRIMDIAKSMDLGSGKQVYTLAIRNGDASEIGLAVQNILSQGAATATTRVTVDPRSNVLIFNGDEKTFEMVKGLVVDLDIPGRPVASSVPVTRVYALKFADATSMAEVLRGLVSGGGTMTTNPVPDALTPQVAAVDDNGNPVTAEPAPKPVASFASEDITIQPVLESNSVVVRARAEVQADLAALIAKLDQRRPQVLIEAAIVEVSGDISDQLGIQLGLGAATPPGGFAATSFSTTGTSLQNILRLLGSPASAAVSTGLSIGLSRQDEFGLLLQAFGQSSKANLLSTPSITTLDNQPAEIIVGQNVPFRTGSFSADTQGAFTTIERRDVGITMRVVPRVNQGDVVQLDISQEVSSLLNTNVAGAADLVTNRRSIKTTVLADNGGTIVLGGLITDDRQSTRSQVPGLGNLPVIGGLFRSRNESARRQTLFVFLRPTILRSRGDVAAVADRSFVRLKSIEAEGVPQQGNLLNERKPVRNLPVEINGLY